MVLNDVANDPGLFVELAAPLDPERLGHGDLHVFDVVPVQNRLEKGVGEAEVEDVLHRLLAEVVIDAKDVLLRIGLVQDPVQIARRSEIASERFLENDPAVPRAAGVAEVLHHDREEARRDREVGDRMARPGELLGDRREGRRIVVVAVDVGETRG